MSLYDKLSFVGGFGIAFLLYLFYTTPENRHGTLIAVLFGERSFNRPYNQIKNVFSIFANTKLIMQYNLRHMNDL